MGGRLRPWRATVTVLLMAAGCGRTPAVPPPPQPVEPPVAAAAAPALQTQQAGFGNVAAQQRWENCRRLGSQAVTRRIAGRIVRQAVRDYSLQRFVSQADINAARRRMVELLVWRIGSAEQVCQQYVRRGIESFERRFEDDAAGLLLGLVGFDRGRPHYRIPRHLLLGGGRQLTPRLLRDLGLPTEAAFQRTRDGYDLPLDTDEIVSRRLIELAIQNRLQDRRGRGRDLDTRPGRIGRL